MALHAVRAHAMVLHLLAHGRFFRVRVRGARRQRRHVRRRVRRTHAEHVGHDPFAARDRRRAIGFGAGCEERPLAQQPAARLHVRTERDATELAAGDVLDAVMLGQPLVDERVVGVQQVHDAAIVADDRVEQQLHLPPHGLTKRIVEVRIDAAEAASSRRARADSATARRSCPRAPPPSDRAACAAPAARAWRARSGARRPPASAAPRQEPSSRGRTTAATPGRCR